VARDATVYPAPSTRGNGWLRLVSHWGRSRRLRGGCSTACFQEVRTASLKHWLDLDRNAMFEALGKIVPVKP